MATLRFSALEKLATRKTETVSPPDEKISSYFGKHVFGETAMREFLSKEAYTKVKDAVLNGTSIERNIADQVALGMKAWAMSLGVTHYTHWFQPLNGATA
jgi:glutamine synthetase